EGMRNVLRWTLTAVALSGVMLGAATASAQTISVTMCSSPVFYADFSPSGSAPVLNAMYTEFKITNTGAVPITNPFATMTIAAGGTVSLNEDNGTLGVYRLRDVTGDPGSNPNFGMPLAQLDPGQTAYAFFFIKASGPQATPQALTICVYSGDPN